MKRLRTFNDMAHVAAWLSEMTGDDWESLDIVDLCIKHGVNPHVQCLAPPFTDNELPGWALEGSPVEVVFNQDLPRFLAGQGVVHMVRHNDNLYQMTPGMPATIDDLRLSEHAALELLERMNERTARDAADCSDSAGISEQSAHDSAAAAPLSRQRHQEQEILRTLKGLGYDPQRLPFPQAGKPGPRAETRARLPEMTPNVFKKAWERLSGYGDIAYAD